MDFTLQTCCFSLHIIKISFSLSKNENYKSVYEEISESGIHKTFLANSIEDLHTVRTLFSIPVFGGDGLCLR